MTRYVAFLRAINVGGHVVTMAVLKREFEALGFTNVSTFIASGNVIFETGSRGDASVAAKIEKRLRTSLGYDVATFVRCVESVRAIGSVGSGGPGALFVGFLAARPSAAAARRVEALSTAADTVTVDGREVYWHASRGFSKSTISAAAIEKALGAPMTMRNINTVRRLAAKLS